MNYFLNLLMSGLVIGSLYGLISMGFAIVYRATGMVNFAVGETMMLIAYISYNLAQFPGLGFAGLLLTTIPISVMLGLLMTLAVMLNLLVGSLVGVMVPLGLEKMGRDPAMGSSVLLTFTTDSMGFFIFLGLASIFF